MKRILLLTILIMSICSNIILSNNTLLKDFFRPNTHIINRDTLKYYDGYSDRFYPYRLHNFDFLSYYEGGEWNNLVVGTFDLDSGRLAFASKDMNYFSNQSISKMQKVCSDNNQYIYVIRNIYNPIKIFKAYFYKNAKKFVICDSFISYIYPKPLDIDINFENTINDLTDDKIWAVANNNIMLLKFDTKDKTLFKKKSWTNIGGNSKERYTCISIGKDYGIQNNYIYVYDSLNNRILRLYEYINNYNQPTLTLVSSRTMPSDWIIKSITTDYFGSVWLSEYNHGFLQSYTPNLQQALTTANWSFRANKPVSFTMAMDKPYGILTERWTDTTGVRLYKLGTEIFYNSVKQDNPHISQIHLHFRVTVGSYMTFWANNTNFIYNTFYLPGEYDRYFTVPNDWSSGTKSYSLKATSACTNPDGSPTAVVTKTGVFNYSSPPPPSPLHLSGYVDSFSTKATAGHYAHLSWIFNRPDSSHTETDSFVMFKDNNRVLSLPYTLNGWTDPVKYGYIGESHTYQLYAWYHDSTNGIDMYSLSNSLTLTADSSTPPGSGCPYFYIKENGAYIPQNTIMHYGYGNKHDDYLFNYNLGEKGALRKKRIIDDRGESPKREIEAAISENEIERDYIDRFNLKAIKYDSSYNLALNGEGEYIFWKDVYRIDSCKNAVGEDILPLVSNSGDGYYVALPGDTIYIYADIRNGNKADIGEKRNKDSGILIGSGVKPKEKGGNVEPSIEIEYTGGKG